MVARRCICLRGGHCLEHRFSGNDPWSGAQAFAEGHFGEISRLVARRLKGYSGEKNLCAVAAITATASSLEIRSVLTARS